MEKEKKNSLQGENFGLCKVTDDAQSVQSENCRLCKAPDNAQSAQRENYGPCKASDSAKSVQSEKSGPCKASDSAMPAQKGTNWSEVAAKMILIAAETDELIGREIKEAEREIEIEEKEIKKYEVREQIWGVCVWVCVCLGVLSIVFWFISIVRENLLVATILLAGAFFLFFTVLPLISGAHKRSKLKTDKESLLLDKIKEKEHTLERIRFKLGIKNEEDESESE